MNRLVPFAALFLSAGSAHADARADLQDGLADFLRLATAKYHSDSDLANARPAGECRDQIAAATRAGLKPEDELELVIAVQEIVKTDRKGSRNGTRLIAAKDAPRICDAYAVTLEKAALKNRVQAGYDLGDWLKLVKPAEVPTATNTTAKAQACLDAIDAAKAAGVKGE